MDASRKLLVPVMLAIVVMLNLSEARVHPHFLGSAAFEHSHSDYRKTFSVQPVSESLRRIPPSDPNPTQNRSKPRLKD